MKGQWFLISAVVATGVFLAISTLFKSYLVIDTAGVARTNEDFYFHNIDDQFNALAARTNCDDRVMREFRAFVEREMGNLGYLVYMNYPPDCSTLSLLLASEKVTVCQNIDPTAILPNIDITCS
jgi:hypothetical protein